MTAKPRLTVCAISAALLFAAAVPTHAGQNAGGPGGQSGGGGVGPPQAPPSGQSGAPRAWFGGGVGSVGQTLTGNVGVSGGRFLRDPDLTINPGAARTDSTIASLFGGLFYGLDAGRGSLSAGFNSYGNYYEALSEDILVGFSGSVSGSFRATSRTTITAAQGAYYEPPLVQSLGGIFGPGAGGGNFVPPSIDPGAIEERALRLDTSVGFSQQLTSRSDLSVDFRHWRYDLRSDDFVQISNEGGIRYTYQLLEGLSARAGYRYGVSRVDGDPDAPRTERSGIDAGLDYGRALSLTRTTKLTFGAGTTVARENDDSRFFVVGNVGLDQMIGRSWSTGVYYRRNADFVEGITGIVQTDSVGTYLGGQLGRRMSVNAQAGATRGGIGIENRNPFTTYVAGAGTSIAVSREVGVGVNYSYYRSEFASGDFLLSPGLQNYQGHSVSTNLGWRYLQFSVAYSRSYYLSNKDQSLTASVSLFAPLFARTRRPNAAR